MIVAGIVIFDDPNDPGSVLICSLGATFLLRALFAKCRDLRSCAQRHEEMIGLKVLRRNVMTAAGIEKLGRYTNVVEKPQRSLLCIGLVDPSASFPFGMWTEKNAAVSIFYIPQWLP